MPKKKHPPPDFGQHCAEYKLGRMSTTEIASACNVAKATVLRWMNDAGVERDMRSAHIGRAAVGNTKRIGFKASADTLRRMSEARMGKPFLAMRGYRHTDASKAKMSAFQRSRLRTKVAPSTRRLTEAERIARSRARDACKRMLRRILTMVRVRKDRRTEDLLGYTKEELRAHIEAQFRPGMSWTRRHSFHIDHRKPVAAFLREGITDPAVINALSNLQVLTPAENRAKSDRYQEIN